MFSTMVRKILLSAASATFVFALGGLADAQEEPRNPSAGEILATYYAGKQDIKDRFNDMALSAYNAAVWSNGYVGTVMHQTPMFCIPDGTFLDGPAIFGMVRDMIGGDPKFAQAEFELVIVAGMIKNYPCRT